MEKKDKEINQANWFLSAATPVLCKLQNGAQERASFRNLRPLFKKIRIQNLK